MPILFSTFICEYVHVNFVKDALKTQNLYFLHLDGHGIGDIGSTDDWERECLVPMMLAPSAASFVTTLQVVMELVSLSLSSPPPPPPQNKIASYTLEFYNVQG